MERASFSFVLWHERAIITYFDSSRGNQYTYGTFQFVAYGSMRAWGLNGSRTRGERLRNMVRRCRETGAMPPGPDRSRIGFPKPTSIGKARNPCASHLPTVPSGAARATRMSTPAAGGIRGTVLSSRRRKACMLATTDDRASWTNDTGAGGVRPAEQRSSSGIVFPSRLQLQDRFLAYPVTLRERAISWPWSYGRGSSLAGGTE